LFSTTLSDTWLEMIPLINLLIASFISTVTSSECETEDFMKSTLMGLSDCMLYDVQNRDHILAS
jgi:hypothetical protein